ncbi:MAG TPA: sensor domain-containing diguanylate cyclase [Pyrinomonadaceae bacterium]|jgi:diguanylate cyclase (GGDEF)-like protein
MYSLYSAILAQHFRQLTPVRCAEQTIAQLHRYFEDVVLENSLAALVAESLPYAAERPIRDRTRVREMARAARSAFFFVRPGDALNNLALKTDGHNLEPVLLQRASTDKVNERFVVIADARFSALLASVHGNEDDGSAPGDEVIWTFQPDIVYSALEYLMARVTAEQPYQAAAFSNAVSASMPKATSLQLTVSVTTKLARLLQEQAGREIAINRIATSIRNSLKLDSILQTTVNEVGRAVNARYCALRVEGEAIGQTLTHCYFHPEKQPDTEATTKLLSEIDTYNSRLAVSLKSHVQDGEDCGEVEAGAEAKSPLAVVPLIFHDRFMGTLLVGSDHEGHTWEENELLLLHTVADQVTVAVNQAHLFAQIEQQALTDGLTGCYNRRSFEMQLEKDLHMATRQRQPLSLVMLDVDNFKQVNDKSGHEAGDNALRMLADCLREELRGVDSAARFGGDEFAVILPQADNEGAMLVAERLRVRLEQTDVAGFGPISASFGVATFPLHASSRDTLVVAADRALYSAKHGGRNRVCLPPADGPANGDEVSPSPQTFSGTDGQLPVPVSEPVVPFNEIVIETF